MPQTSETRAGEARASSKQLACWLLDSRTPCDPCPQAIPPLIALHLGADFCADWKSGEETDG